MGKQTEDMSSAQAATASGLRTRGMPVSFRVAARKFLLDDKPFQILAGGMHYFRVMPEQWPHRLRLLRAMGLNTIDTYVPWNFHEPRAGEYLFEGLRDIERFLKDAAEAGLYAIVRPGPYICSEWDNGGLPGWLLADRDMRLRCSDERFVRPLERWFDELIPRLLPHQVSAGGNIILMQIENDYARFGSDTRYSEILSDGLRRRGVDVPLYVCEAPSEVGIGTLGLKDVLGSVWFEYDPEAALSALDAQLPDDPPFCSELVCGPIQHWGEPLQTRDAAMCERMLEQVVSRGASFSLYMAHGGTNFGFWSGANDVQGQYAPAVTSYDYDSPLDEQGVPTDKYWRFRNILSRYGDLPAPDLQQPPKVVSGSLRLSGKASLFDVARSGGRCLHGLHPATFEDLGQQHGFVLYRTSVTTQPGRHMLELNGLGDRAQIFVDGRECALLERGGEKSVQLEFTKSETVLEILVESMGRVNFSPQLGERKGIAGGVRLGWRWLYGWSSLAIDPEAIKVEGLPVEDGSASYGPVLFCGELHVAPPTDMFLGFRGWKKGCAWVNGFCLGRYWDRGPHRSLYVPAPLVRQGSNQVVVLELHPAKRRDMKVEILDAHDCD